MPCGIWGNIRLAEETRVYAVWNMGKFVLCGIWGSYAVWTMGELRGAGGHYS